MNWESLRPNQYNGMTLLVFNAVIERWYICPHMGGNEIIPKWWNYMKLWHWVSHSIIHYPHKLLVNFPIFGLLTRIIFNYTIIFCWLHDISQTTQFPLRPYYIIHYYTNYNIKLHSCQIIPLFFVDYIFQSKHNWYYIPIKYPYKIYLYIAIIPIVFLLSLWFFARSYSPVN